MREALIAMWPNLQVVVMPQSCADVDTVARETTGLALAKSEYSPCPWPNRCPAGSMRQAGQWWP